MSAYVLSGRLLPEMHDLDWTRPAFLLARTDDYTNYPDTALVLADGLVWDDTKPVTEFLQENVTLVADLQELTNRLPERPGAIWMVYAVDPMSQWFCDLCDQGALVDWPDDIAMDLSVWNAAAMYLAKTKGEDVNAPELLPVYDFSGLRRMLFAQRARYESEEDRFMGKEFELLERAARENLEPGVPWPQVLRDMRDALDGKGPMPQDNAYSVIVVTKPQYKTRDIGDFGGMWRNVVIAHGLSLEAATWVWLEVKDRPDLFIDWRRLLSESVGSEYVGQAFIVADAALEWGVVDLSQRRNVMAYEAMRERALDTITRQDQRQADFAPAGYDVYAAAAARSRDSGR